MLIFLLQIQVSNLNSYSGFPSLNCEIGEETETPKTCFVPLPPIIYSMSSGISVNLSSLLNEG